MKNVVRLGMVVAAVSAIVVVLILGCHMGVGTAQPIERDGAREIARDDSSTEPVTGAVVAVPTISPQLVAALNARYEPISGAGVRGGEVSGQALLFASRVELDLLQGEDAEVIRSWVFENDPAHWQVEENARWEQTLEIEPGEGYLLHARVFNDKVSGAAPVVAGISDAFEIMDGQETPVEIIAIPETPQRLTSDGDAQTVGIAQLPYRFTDQTDHDIVIEDYGGEAWFNIAVDPATDRYARIIADPGPAGGGAPDVVMLRYGEDGIWLDAGENAPPAQSWGFFPDAAGGRGGTRAGLLHPVTAAALNEYIGVVLLGRDGDDNDSDVTLRLDFLERPEPSDAYANIAAPGVIPEFDGLDPLDPSSPQEQTVFLDDGGLPTVHWFPLDVSGWQTLPRFYDISIRATFDVLEKAHLFGGVRGEGNEFSHHMLALLTFEEDAGLTTAVYLPVDDDAFTVTEDVDNTTLAFTARVDTQNVARAAIAVSSRFAGNQFEIGWEPPPSGGANVTIQ